MNDIFNFFSPLSFVKSGTVAYNPLINYDWSTTTTSGLRYLRDVGSTPTYNASMYFGRGAYLNGVDQRLEDVLLKEPLGDIGVLCFRVNPSNLNFTYTISNAYGNARFYIKKESSGWYVGLADTAINTGIIPIVGESKDMILAWNNGTFTLSVGNDSYTNTYNGSCAGINKLTVSSSQRYTPNYFGGVLKDMSIFNRALTHSEITQFYEQPELFYAMAQADSTCVLNMPMCETSSTTRNYKTGIDYAITNYTSSVRDNAKNLQYGLQTCKFVRDSLGVIQSASDYLECDGVGYVDTGWVLNTSIFDIEFIFNMKDFSTRGSFESIFGVREVTDANTQNICLTLSYTNNNIKILTGDSWGQVFNVPVGKSHFILRYDGTSIYLIRNGISIYNKITTIIPNLNTLILGAEQYIASVRNNLNSELRLFKIHSAIQDPQELYNKALAKGLLS